MWTKVRSFAWLVWRQDDHGRKAVIAQLREKNAAEKLADELESKAHHQTYWISKGDSNINKDEVLVQDFVRRSPGIAETQLKRISCQLSWVV